MMAATRVSITWLGVRKTLTPAQKEQAADTFGAEGGFVSAGKKLLDTSAPAFKLVTSVRGRAVAYWKGLTLPFPEPGIRLIRQSDVDLFTRQMAVFQAELSDAVSELNAEYGDLKRAAANRLGSLYNPADYPTSLLGLFSIEYDFPSVEPPDYLRQLRPDLYEQECARVQQRFNEAVELAEQAFVGELQRLVSHLNERLTGEQDGRPKVFRDSAVENLAEFFERFRRLNIRSNHDLDEIVHQATSNSLATSRRLPNRRPRTDRNWSRP
jgi:hypothetical protein